MKEELGGSEMFIDLMNNKKVALNESGNLLLPSKTARIYLLN
jgi:hypothetical protein